MSIRIILIGTTHPGNIGAVARAMKNMGLHDLVLVSPRSFPHEDATARASGADDILANTRVVGTLDEALTDCIYVAGASARSRTIGWPSMVPRECAERLHEESQSGTVAAVCGPEKSGLNNDDLDRCHTLLTIPTDPGFSSLNLAMAVQILTYELRIATMDDPQPESSSDVRLASGEELQYFYAHLEQVLTVSGFMESGNPSLAMRRLRRLFGRAEPDKNEINMLRGILASLDPDAKQRKVN